MNRETAGESWFPCAHPRPQAECRLFCFPFAGAGVAAYARWPQALPSTVEMRPVQLPGRESRMRETPYDHCVALTEAIAERMEIHLDRPFAFFGHSMGALLAFETARVLRRRGRPTPGLLVLSSRPAPQLPKPHAPVHQLPRDEFLGEIQRLFDPPNLAWREPALMEIMLPTLRADMSVCDTYEYNHEPPLHCPIHAIGGDADPTTPVQALQAWREQTDSAFEFQVLPGRHFYLNENTPRVLEHIEDALAALQT